MIEAIHHNTASHPALQKIEAGNEAMEMLQERLSKLKELIDLYDRISANGNSPEDITKLDELLDWYEANVPEEMRNQQTYDPRHLTKEQAKEFVEGLEQATTGIKNEIRGISSKVQFELHLYAACFDLFTRILQEQIDHKKHIINNQK